MPKKYSREPGTDKSVKASGSDIRVSFKNTYETAKTMKGRTIEECRKYFEQVLNHERCIPFTRFNGGIGRTPQAKEFGLVQGRWPEKSIKYLLSLLDNLQANANNKNLDLKSLRIRHVQLNRAPKGRRRTYRAHGRVTPYLSSPFHIEVWAEVEQNDVAKPEAKEKVYSLKKQAKRRRIHKLTVG